MSAAVVQYDYPKPSPAARVCPKCDRGIMAVLERLKRLGAERDAQGRFLPRERGLVVRPHRTSRTDAAAPWCEYSNQPWPKEWT